MNYTSNESSESCKNVFHNGFVWEGSYILRKSGMKYKDIEALTGVNKKSARSIVVRIEKNESLEKRKGPGRKPKGSEADIKLLVRYVQKEPFATFSQVQAYAATFGLTVNKKTIISYLAQKGFNSYWAAHKPTLTDRHRESRLNWALHHVNWDIDQWKGAVWSDEARLRVENNDCAA